MPSLNTHLGYRTHFSLGESVLTPADIVKSVKDGGVERFAVCDTMSVSSMIELTQKATKEGLKPTVGVRLRVMEELVRDKKAKREATFIKVFPRTEEGQKIIYRLLTTAFDEDHFYEVPRLAWSDFKGIEGGHLVWTTGDIDGVFTDWNSNAHLAAMLAVVPEGDPIYAELMPINTPFFDRVNAETLKAIITRGLEPLVTLPALYEQGEFEPFFVSLAIQKRSNLERPFTVSIPTWEDAFPHHYGDVLPRIRDTRSRLKARYEIEDGDLWKDGLLNSEKFLNECAYVWTPQEVSLPEMADDPDAAVQRACANGMKERLFKQVNGYQPTPEAIRNEYIPRLKYELDVLKTLKFSTYFLVVSDVVNWSKDQGIVVGPGRGSVGGSLVAFLMGITDVDPIRFGLLFERFINPSRNDLPDADLDFMSTRRQEVVEYLEKRHGTENVAGITNYGVLGASSAMRDVARIYGMNVMDIGESKMVPAVHGQPVDLLTAAKEVTAIQKWAEKNPDVWRNAVKLEGTMRNYGKHAAGIIVSGVPLTERAVVERREGARTINWNMAVSENAGLVKLDILGLSTLDTLYRCAAYIKERHGKTIDLSAIPLDDEKTLAMLSAGRTQGVFQFEGGSARRLLRDMSRTVPLTFDDLVAANALNRPGPIEAGLVKQYVDAKNGHDLMELPHPKLEGALGETFNVICYQEQVMRVSVDLCGYSLSDADKLRKIMGKKLPEEMEKQRTVFVEGAVTHSGMDPEAAEDLFETIAAFAGYAFNKSHAVEYSLISYQCAWLKAHYPVEFYAASLSTVGEAKLDAIVADADKMGIKIMPPDINISEDQFVIANDTTLYIPFNRVKGISDKASLAIMEARNLSSIEVEHKEKVGRRVIKSMVEKPVTKGRFDSIEDFRERVPGRAVNSRHMETLKKVGAFHRIDPDCRIHPQHEDRRRDQHELIPGLVADYVVINRDIPKDKYAMLGINQIYRDVDSVAEKSVNVRPYFGKNARFMAIFDAPGRTDELNKQVASGDSFGAVAEALFEAGLDRTDGYFTALCKRVKAGSMLTGAEIDTYAPFLAREIQTLKPPLIITLGSNASRHLVPSIKGNVLDYAGKVFYNRELDANILIGFTPGMIHFDPEKQTLLNDVFALAARLIE